MITFNSSNFELRELMFKLPIIILLTYFNLISFRFNDFIELVHISWTIRQDNMRNVVMNNSIQTRHLVIISLEIGAIIRFSHSLKSFISQKAGTLHLVSYIKFLSLPKSSDMYLLLLFVREIHL